MSMKPGHHAQVPLDEGTTIVNEARLAHEAGWSVFTTTVVVGFTSGSGLGIGGKRTTRSERWEPAQLIAAVEALGWHLANLDHVWVQTEQNNALGPAAQIRGLVEARMMFRRRG
ncbi:MAG TPA: hypothetical protein VNR17_10215 [Luteimicrobium sp.]|nr:hypothetical protein [Luteimicrobium sp.]